MKHNSSKALAANSMQAFVGAVLSLSLVPFFVPLAEAQPMTLKSFRQRPKLVVTIVIDQCRSDFLTRFEKRMGSVKNGGLTKLMSSGAYFPNGKYDLLQSMTCPGHAVIATGTNPYQMGIPLNEWYDVSKKTDVYCAGDETSPIVGGAGPASGGLSPRRLVGSTVSDELKMAGHKSKVIAIGMKDRSAIMLGGHLADLALWIDEGRWVSSKYYLPKSELPAWVLKLNEALEKEKGSTFKWTVRGELSGLTAETKNVSGAAMAIASAAAKREVIAGSKESFATQYGVKLTTDAAIRAIEELKLGRGTSPDFLALSYSSHDMMGHALGLQSSELEELTMFEDESLGELLNAIEKSVGLSNTVFVFTGDHGVAPPVDLLLNQGKTGPGIPAGHIVVKDLLEELNKGLDKEFGKSSKGPWIARVRSFNFYLDTEVMKEKKKSREQVEAALKKLILRPSPTGVPLREGVQHVFTRGEWEARKLPVGRFERQILNSYVLGQSGDVVLILKPFWAEKGAFATHSTGYSYDRSVPIIISGGGAKPGVYAKDIDVSDIAPTLSFILGVVAPSGADGRVLHEVFESR